MESHERTIEMEQGNRKDGNTDGSAKQRKPYSAPQLTVFGQVAALTQNTSCSASSDSNVACAPGASGTMGTMASDRRLKERIVRIGDHPAGFGLYLFHYRADFRDARGHGRRFGVMADEVQAVIPQAVVTGDDGFLSVRYDILGIRPTLH
jgi:hypothetical protein